MDKERLQETSVLLIAYAGDAYGHFNEAINQARAGDFEEADRELAAGRESIAEGHKAQIELLAAEGRGDDLTFSLLLVHAQDHLMMAMSFENVARQMIELCRDRTSGGQS